MKILILGQDPSTARFVNLLLSRPDHEIVMSCPPWPGLPGTTDLETALATPGINAALVGGPLAERGELLRRSAGQGWTCLCLHPPGLNTDPYYQVALSNHEFKAIVLPDLPLRFHPGIAAMRQATRPGGPAGPVRSIVLETNHPHNSQSLVLDPFAAWVDVVRLLLGEIENIAAMGFPAGTSPTERLTAQLRGPGDRRAEVIVRTEDKPASARLTVTARDQVIVLECDPNGPEGGRLCTSPTGATSPEGMAATELPPWNPTLAIVGRWAAAAQLQSPLEPALLDGMRSMEVAEGAIRSLRRGRALDLHYEEVSEANNFKTIMTSVGCMMVVAVLFGLPLILAGPALGLHFTLYLGYLIPLAFVAFALLQVLRFAIRND